LAANWLATGSTGGLTALGAAAVGALAAAALAVNNHRDREHDQLVGRQTFAALFGAYTSRVLFGLLLTMPFVLLVAMCVLAGAPWLALLVGACGLGH
jgi:1,4-dihydroxy-2-naphthoate octaprenyltransferase